MSFELLLGNQAITVQSETASLNNAREVKVSHDAKLEGLAPGDQVTVLGTVISSGEPFTVQAQAICGGEKEECVQQYSESTSVGSWMATFAFLAGGGLVWLGIWRLKQEAAFQQESP